MNKTNLIGVSVCQDTFDFFQSIRKIHHLKKSQLLRIAMECAVLDDQTDRGYDFNINLYGDIDDITYPKKLQTSLDDDTFNHLMLMEKNYGLDRAELLRRIVDTLCFDYFVETTENQLRELSDDIRSISKDVEDIKSETLRSPE